MKKANKGIQKIKPLVGNLYLYRARPVRVEGFAAPGDEIEIYTDKHTIRFPADKLDDELENFMPMNEPDSEALVHQRESVEKQAIAIFQQDAGQMNQVENVVMDNIKKLQGEDGEEYLEQATAINDQVKTLLDMTKTKLKMHQEIRKSKKLST